MYLLKDNKIINVDTSEDRSQPAITAIKTVEQLKEEHARINMSDAIKKDQIYTLNWIDDYGKGEFCFKMTQSPYDDNSGLKNGHGVHRTKGRAIMNMLENGFRVFNGDVEITKP